ncbi:MAG: geranylgeranyl diphosphate reductase [Sandaracinobacteroides sp.]
MTSEQFDAVVVGGGPSGATAADDLARAGARVALLDRAGRIKPCGGAVPPRLLKDFDIPLNQLVARATSARMIAPSGNAVSMPVGNGFVGLVDRDQFDEWLRARAESSGATRIAGTFEGIDRDSAGNATVRFRPKGSPRGSAAETIRARLVIGADGANSAVARTELPKSSQPPFVAAYHEVIESPAEGFDGFDGGRCDVFYQGKYSPDFYAWVFPHGPHSSIGVGSAKKGFPLREAVAELRAQIGLDQCRTIRVEGAPIPMKPRKRWDNGRDVVVAGDAAGVVAPASGEGIYYAMTAGRYAADAGLDYLRTGNARALASARKRFMSEHGKVFWVLGMMQYFWYSSDNRRERFVKICEDPDVQYLTWEAYMHKKLVKAKPAAHARIFMKDMGHLIGSLAR